MAPARPGGSWAFSRVFGEETSRSLAGLCLALAALGFVAGGVAFLAGLPWWLPLVVGSAVLSSLVYILCWDGGWQDAHDQGAIGLLINVAVITAVLLSL